MIELLLVGAGGFIGSTFRYVLMQLFSNIASNSSFPWGIFIANISGSLLIGLLAGLTESRNAINPEIRLFLFVGLLGGFTTFSSITNDTLTLFRSSQFVLAFANIGLTVFLGMLFVALGYFLARSN
ncbi:MAG: fluoride efflux transporter CrcB [Chloroflexi bacterium]|jgi:CrcB protein|nr:fluoride efflux transporter CrcB [Chloroflexota bacterium]MBN85930.1 fluoride efflux transporter CrcB [Dehalococcoidia bacterium]MCH2531262.1 fluoride efflux transporter CrcB [Dehalococcoidia bacterium]HCH35713.1 fluoride efflux transporter CrcB [Dehalococcoidia bacterium]|tara:strand:+ start:1738 stop:2115 length:378 start_codon:yes stop_codon:yes gene_type:complete